MSGGVHFFFNKNLGVSLFRQNHAAWPKKTPPNPPATPVTKPTNPSKKTRPRSPCSLAMAAASATLPKRQKPRGTSTSAWWPGFFWWVEFFDLLDLECGKNMKNTAQILFELTTFFMKRCFLSSKEDQGHILELNITIDI